MTDELLGVDEAADYLTVSRRTLYRIVKDGDIKPVKMVVGTRFRRKDLDAYLLRQTRGGTEAGPLSYTRFTLYRFYDAEGVLLYVGLTTQGGTRWLTHAKEKSWWLEVATIKVEHLDSLEELVAAELAAIRTEGPRYNVKDVPR
jgi:excisionase family DNA binding protein